MVENIARGGAVRRGGKITPVPAAWRTRDIPFGDRSRRCVSIPWGDVSTAFHSTGIPNIEVYTGVPSGAATFMRMSRPVSGLLGAGWIQRALKKWVDGRPAGPSDAARAGAKSELWGEACDASGTSVTSTLDTPDGYTLTAATALDLAKRVAAGEFSPGFMTPSKAYGVDYVLGFAGVTRRDL